MSLTGSAVRRMMDKDLDGRGGNSIPDGRRSRSRKEFKGYCNEWQQCCNK